MDEVRELTKGYPHFSDGRIDYTNERVCPVIICTVLYDNELLLTHRSADVIAYPNMWNGIAGFIDELKPLEDIVRDELAEEVSIQKDDINKITIRPRIIQVDEAINREWYAFPVLVELRRRPEIKTNWENKAAQWVTRDQLSQLDLVPLYPEILRAAIGDVL